MQVTNKTYDFLNALVRLILPAIGTFYFTLTGIFDLPYGAEVVGTITALCLLLGIVVKAAKSGWKIDDELVIEDSQPNEVGLGLVTSKPMSQFKHGDIVTLKVNKLSEEG